MKTKNHLVELYGDNALELVLEEINRLAKCSNIPFDKKYVQLGYSFLIFKAEEISQGKQKQCSLKSLVSESFGEAAIYKYNCNDGVL